MAEYGFFRVGKAVAAPLSIIVAPTLADAKRRAVEAIDAEDLEAVRLWVDGQHVIVVRRTYPGMTPAVATTASVRDDMMLARRREGATALEIAEEFGLSANSIGEVLAKAAHRSKMRAEQPNRAALPARAHQLLMQVLVEPEDDPGERDRLLPERVASLTRQGIEGVPNIGRATVVKIEAWLWERGLTLG